MLNFPILRTSCLERLVVTLVLSTAFPSELIYSKYSCLLLPACSLQIQNNVLVLTF